MLPKIIYIISLILIFILEFLGLKSYMRNCHKRRMIDTIIGALIIVGYLLIIGMFTKIYDMTFHIF